MMLSVNDCQTQPSIIYPKKSLHERISYGGLGMSAGDCLACEKTQPESGKAIPIIGDLHWLEQRKLDENVDISPCL